METKYIDTTKTGDKPEPKKTVFTHHLSPSNGWELDYRACSDFLEVKYLGNCKQDGHMFAALSLTGNVLIFKGTKGDEFN